jgi:hypothetical protein
MLDTLLQIPYGTFVSFFPRSDYVALGVLLHPVARRVRCNESFDEFYEPKYREIVQFIIKF